MKKKKLQLFRIFILIFATFTAVFANGGLRIDLNKTALAVGDLVVDWGVPSGDPIFVVNNMAPGDCETKTVNVTNNGTANREVGVRGVKTSETGNVGTVLEIKITVPSTLYGPETLEQFFTDSNGPNATPLTTLTPTQSENYNFEVCFPESAGNEFQNASVVFDLIIGIVIPTPAECEDINFAGNPIFGTSGNDRLRGTPQNDLIFGLEGNDRIDGGGGNDCIVGGEGNDRIDDSTGQDVIFGNEGNDDIDAGSNNDLVIGGDGNDKLEGGSGNDKVLDNLGEDKLSGGSGHDELFGGDQNDLIEGGSGNDILRGEGGNDNLKGGSDNDNLDGGLGTNVLNGDSGVDICTNGPTFIKCETIN